MGKPWHREEPSWPGPSIRDEGPGCCSVHGLGRGVQGRGVGSTLCPQSLSIPGQWKQNVVASMGTGVSAEGQGPRKTLKEPVPVSPCACVYLCVCEHTCVCVCVHGCEHSRAYTHMRQGGQGWRRPLLGSISDSHKGSEDRPPSGGWDMPQGGLDGPRPPQEKGLQKGHRTSSPHTSSGRPLPAYPWAFGSPPSQLHPGAQDRAVGAPSPGTALGQWAHVGRADPAPAASPLRAQILRGLQTAS